MGGATLREDILAAAGVSSGSFYHQFSGKEDLLLEILRFDGAVVLETLRKANGSATASGGMGPFLHTRERLLNELFDLTDRNPEFVKIFVREYYSDSPAVRREIRRHSERTIEHVRAYYEPLRDSTGVPLDLDRIATLITVQVFAVVNFYLDFPKSKRAAAREKLIRSMIELGQGGLLAMRSWGEA